MSKTFPVLEIFGPTIQGEGMVIGKKTMFVRTAGCDFSCSWCDSAFTWDGSAKDEIIQMTAEEIWKKLQIVGNDNFSHVTISGGNPALLKHLDELIRLLKDNNVKVGLETQGSIWQDWFLLIDDLTVSPKPPSSKMKTNYNMLDKIVTEMRNHDRLNNVSLKVVIFDDEDLIYAKKIAKRYPDVSLFLQVGNDEIDTEDDKWLVEHLLKKYEQLVEKVVLDKAFNNVRVLPQLHTLVWGNKRGV